jgi:hypothetical protein
MCTFAPLGASLDREQRATPARRGEDTMHRTRALIAASIAALALTGCSSSAPPVTAHGELTVYNNPFSGLSMSEAYPDVTNGGQVTVTDSSGKVIGTGTLSYSKTDTFSFLVQAEVKYPQIGQSLSGDIALYRFTVSGLPGGLPRYGFMVGKGHGTIWVNAKNVKDPGLSLGSLT